MRTLLHYRGKVSICEDEWEKTVGGNDLELRERLSEETRGVEAAQEETARKHRRAEKNLHRMKRSPKQPETVLIVRLERNRRIRLLRKKRQFRGPCYRQEASLSYSSAIRSTTGNNKKTKGRTVAVTNATACCSRRDQATGFKAACYHRLAV